MKEKDGYRDMLESIRSKYGDILTVSQVAELMKCNSHTVLRMELDGWHGNGRGKRISAPALARQIV